MKSELNKMILQKMRPRYQKAKKLEKSQILGTTQEMTGLNRKSIIRLLNSRTILVDAKRSGRPGVYQGQIREHVLKLYKLMEEISPKRMKEAIPIWLPYYNQHYGPLPVEIQRQLKEVSASTLERIIRASRGANEGISSTRVNKDFKNIIPLKKLDEEVTAPGTVQADTVAHCGAALLGNFINTVTVVDLCSSWTENRACWTKETKHLLPQLMDIEEDVPFRIINFDTDCGSEFLNYTVMRYFENRSKNRVKMRRSRPYKKNDQAYVEQRNYTHVRNLFGYDRLDAIELVNMMNDIYKNYWNPLHNHFLPSFKLLKKERIGARIKKIFDKPKTPAQRLLEHPQVTNWSKGKVRAQRVHLDPIALKLELERKLKLFYEAVRRLTTGKVNQF